MDREELEEYRHMVAELQELEDKINLLNGSVTVVSGKVTGSSKVFPYLPTRYTVEMENAKEREKVNKRIKKLNDKMMERTQELSKRTLEIEEYIASIKHSEMRRIIEMYFVDGMKLEEVAKEMHMETSTISKKIKKFLNNQTNQKKT